MNKIHGKRTGRGVVALTALAGALLAALLGLSAERAMAAYTAKVKGAKLTIVGNTASDKLVLRLRPGSPTTLELDVGADGTADLSFDRSTFTAIDVQAGRGDDEVRIDETWGAFPEELVTMNGGPGADTLIGGSGRETFIGGADSDVVAGGDANDRALLGDGDDVFRWNPGDDSDIVDGQRGNDLLDFNGSGASEVVDVSANGGHVRFFRNIANIVTDLDGVEGISFDAVGGADIVTVNDLTGTHAQTVDVDLSAVGGGPDAQIDTVVARGTTGADNANIGSSEGRIVFGGLAAVTRVAGGEAHDEVTLATLDGADAIGMAVGVSAVAPINVDGGSEADLVRYNGTAEADQIDVVANGTEVSTVAPATARLDTSVVESLSVFGFGGADTIGSVGNLAALTSLTFDGGEDGDVLRGGNGADVLIGGGGNDALDGNQGSDQLLAGEGDDRFEWNPGDGSDNSVDGQAGNDLLDFFGSGANENIAVTANGQLARLTRNIAAITMDLDGVEELAVHALGGSDTIEIGNLAGTDVGTVDAGLGAFGGGPDGSADAVVVNGTEAADLVEATVSGSEVLADGLAALVRIAGSEAANDTLRIQTLGGDDDVTVAPDVSGLITPIVDLGADD